MRDVGYVGLGSGELLSDLRAIQLIFRPIYGIQNLQLHFIDKKYSLNEFTGYERAQWIFIMSWLRQFSMGLTVYLYKSLENYLELCGQEPERKADVVTIFDLGVDRDNIVPFDYQVLKPGLNEHCLLSYLGYIESVNYIYYDVCIYQEDQFNEVKVYDARKDIKVTSKLWWKDFKGSFYYYTNMSPIMFSFQVVKFGLLGLITYRVFLR